MFFLVSPDDFDVLISKIKKKYREIILIYFWAKSTFEKHHAPQYQTHTS